MSDTIAVRPGEEFAPQAVEQYLRRYLPDLPDAPLQVEQFPTGHSNLTYQLSIGSWQVVLRRPPLGPVAPKAHDMRREHTILRGLHRVFPLAPRPLLFCDDPGVIGAPFYVMERRRGVILDREWYSGWPEDPALRRRICEALVATLVELHAVDYQSAGLAGIGQPEGYLQRQVNGWIQRWQRAETHCVKDAKAVCTWLKEHLPPSPAPTLVHNDYKLNNVMLDPENPSRVVAILDWEMCTIGDPLTDVGVLACYWIKPEDADLGAELTSVTALPGFMERSELLDLYARLSGRDLSRIDFYRAFSYFKIAVICQQIYYRWYAGQTRDERFRSMGSTAERLIARAAQVAATFSA